MAASKPSSFFSSSGSLPPSPLPTTEEFNSYHSIDRELYKILIFKLNRCMVESMKVMAFWIWLEQQNTGGMTLVKNILSLSCDLITKLADESATCLKCMENPQFSYAESGYDKLTVLEVMLRRNVSLSSFYEQRMVVLGGVKKIVDEVCSRAFKDIIEEAVNGKRTPSEDLDINQQGKFSFFSSGGVDQGSQSQGMQYNDNELNEIFGGNLNFLEDENERTIVLTMSNNKASPISEDEIRDFFTRTFGDFIENLEMRPGQKMLEVRLVARVESIVNAVVKGGNAKYNINGKKVYANKFVE